MLKGAYIMKRIQIKYFANKIPKLKKIVKGDWIDLYAAEDVTLKKFDTALISLGVAMKLPEGYEAILAPRSSTMKKFGVIQTNGIGVVDNSYSGDHDEWKMPVMAVRDTEIHVGDRICQFRIQENQPEIEFEEVSHLSDENRGGFGSTGAR